MKEILFRAIIEDFILIPCVRMTQASKWSKRARQYLVSQQSLAWEFRKHCVKGFFIDYPVELTFSIHRPNKRKVDADNCIKSIQDALQLSGIVINDNLIQGYGKSRMFFDGKARLIVELRRL
jgi:Holliday junction resolvase RusA-like endonuclease